MQASGMAYHRSRPDTNLPSRPEHTDPPTQRSTSTRLPTRKHDPRQSSYNTPLQHSQSKLVKKQPGRPAVTNVASAHNEAKGKSSQSKSARGQVQHSSTAAAVRVSRDMSQPGTLLTAPMRIPQYDTESARTPSLVSGSSVSTTESPKSKTLRRKPSNIGRSPSKLQKPSMNFQGDSAVLETLNVLGDPFPDSLLGMAMPVSSADLSAVKQQYAVSMSLQMPYNGAPTSNTPALAGILPPPNPLYALSTTPSTGYSGSPGPFSVSSTPTSTSSYSPATTVTSKATSRVTQASPVKSRRSFISRPAEESEDRMLSSVRESSASSSASTVKTSATGSQNLGRPRTSYDRQASKAAGEVRPKTAVPPPELAHLMNATPIQQQASLPTRPVRPSRENTPDFIGLREPSPIVQSNLQSLPSTGHRRQTSLDSRGAGASSAPVPARPRIIPPSRLPSRNPSPSPSQSSLVSPISRPSLGRGMTPELASDSESGTKKAPSRGTSPSKPGSKFGFFRRKTEPTPSTVPPAEKKLRKGPAAGTGHEGYSRFGLARGRSGSTTSGGSGGGRSPSVDSGTGSMTRTAPSRKSSIGSKGTPEMDDFLRERLEPVPLRGAGPVLPESTSSQIPSKTKDTRSVSPHKRQPAPTTPQLADASKFTQRRPIGDSKSATKPTRSALTTKIDASAQPEGQRSGRFGFRNIGNKRLSRMSTALDNKSSTMLPPPNTANFQDAQATSNVLNDSMQQTVTSQTLSRGLSTKEAAQKPPPKQPGKLARKWNFFQRSQTVPIKETPVLEPSPEIQTSRMSRSMAHYALAEDRGRIDMDELEQIMQEANDSPDEMDAADLAGDVDSENTLLPISSNATFIDNATVAADTGMQEVERPQSPRNQRGHSILLPDPPAMIPPPGLLGHKRSASPKVQLRRDSPERYVLPAPERISPILTTVLDTSEAVGESPPTSPLVAMPPQRQPRLQQVGRIPQVKRDRERKLSIHSFSRPFGSDASPAFQQQSPALQSEESPQVAPEEFPKPPALSDMVAQLRVQSTIDELETPDLKRHSSQTATTIDATTNEQLDDFLTFPPRKDSDFSASTSSGHPSFGTLLATAPATFSLTMTTSEDEIWKEYDDFIDEVLWNPDAVAPFSGTQPIPRRFSRAVALKQQEGDLMQKRRPGNLLAATTNQGNGIGAHVPSLPPIMTPNSPYSVTDFLAAYGAGRLSMSTAGTGNPAAIRDSTISTHLSIPSSTQQTTSSRLATSQSTAQTDADDTSECETASSFDEEDESPTSMPNLRFGALMTSKWLSFGRVLFSPAHSELKDPHEDRVLVVDGLGKDWSHYVALTYKNASVYSLGPDPSAFPSGKAGASNAPIEQMPNHRHIHHPSLNAPFPFPKGFFAAVVFRFPAISTESAYRMALAESKRVLRPGGYLEVSVLDMDPVNMGNKARKAVKSLKMRLAGEHPDWSLNPMSDVVMKLIGRRGFEGLQRCVLGVPAAGIIKPNDNPATAPTPSLSTPGSSSLATPSTATGSSDIPKTTMSFSDLLHSDQSDTTNPEISRMVCKVGRWWYEKCYEAPIFNDVSAYGQQSIWRDEALLGECERLNTTFRLLICCAQKPTGAVRRTVSV